jgi:glutathione S-transferase
VFTNTLQFWGHQMILIGRHYSPFVRRVAATLQHYGLEYEHQAIRASGADQDKIRSYGNPLGRVPVLVMDNGSALADSAVILDYLDSLVGTDKSLMPVDGMARFELQSKIAIANGAAEKAIAVYSESMRPSSGQHQPAMDGSTRQAKDGFEYLDGALTGPWFMGDKISQLDVTVICHWEFMKAGAKTVFAACNCPNIEALAARANALPAFKNTPIET